MLLDVVGLGFVQFDCVWVFGYVNLLFWCFSYFGVLVDFLGCGVGVICFAILGVDWIAVVWCSLVIFGGFSCALVVWCFGFEGLPFPALFWWLTCFCWFVYFGVCCFGVWCVLLGFACY